MPTWPRVFIAFICSVVMAIATARGAGPARGESNLDDAPWRFTKLISQKKNNLSQGRLLTVVNDAAKQTVTVDLGQVWQLQSVRFTFPETTIQRVHFQISTSTNGRDDWTPPVDETATPIINSENAVSATGDTVGLVPKAISASIEHPLTGSGRFVRLDIIKDKDKPVPSQYTLDVFGGSTTASASDADFSKPQFDDSQWELVSVPNCFNDMDTYLNANDAHQWRGTVWYRRHFALRPEEQGRRLWLEFEGVDVGAAVYVNGVFKPGDTAEKQPGEVTHIGGFLSFAVDITDDVKWQGDNVIAVRVSNAPKSFFTWPGFGVFEGFGMGWGGIVCPVHLHSMAPIHIPLNTYSPSGQWGTYFATTAADNTQAQVRAQTQVVNDNDRPATVLLTTQYVDATGATVLSLEDSKPALAHGLVQFDQTGQIANPKLWYPNNSPYGKPYLYRVISTVKVDGQIVDQTESQTGLRVITWDADYCYINGKKHFLNGFGNRNIYPALGSAIPAVLQWRDMQLIAACGGNALRVGHVPAPRATVEACDAYGILIMMDSGDNEWALNGSPADVYKREYDRDMIIAYRNHPSIAIWEANNGTNRGTSIYWPNNTKQVVDQWDALMPRIVLTRDGYPKENWNAQDRIIVGYTNRFTKVAGSPSLNVEVYGANWKGKPCFNAARFDYDDEKQLANWFVNDYVSDVDKKACGWIDWMLAETQGEGYTIYLNGMKKQKSLGSCALDGNRFPKLKYNIYKSALWVDFETRPGVVLQSTWNLSGVQDVDAWSNCPKVELFLNGTSRGIQTPDSRTKRCTWKSITWEAGTLKAVGLDGDGKSVCTDQKVTSGLPDHIELVVEPPLTKPDGTVLPLRANGSDAAIITATIVDAAGNWCPLADNNLRFTIIGPGVYRGSYNFYVAPGRSLNYHAPGDPELAAEGGLMRVAIRTTLEPGTVKVTATADGLGAGAASFETLILPRAQVVQAATP
jgi:hypothetical protein